MFTTTIRASAALLALCAFAAPPAVAQELPKATQEMMKKTKLPADVLADLGKEVNAPEEWIAGAKKEGNLIVGGTWEDGQFAEMIGPFKERYPFLNIKYSRATRHDRVIKPLMAFKAGRVTTDVLSGVGAKFSAFKELDAVEDLRVLPNWNNVKDGMKQPEGGWVGARLRYWCMAYNTAKLSKDDLPKTWEELLEKPKLRDGKIGMGNRPNLWLLSMWEQWGEDRVREYARRLFTEVKPQLRKEGMNALISLAVAGEFDVSLPSAEYRVAQMAARKAPVGWHCPEPVPMAISEMLVMKGGNRNAALLFMNWFLSKEGQVAQFAANKAPPVHKDLHRREFLAYPDEIIGRKIAFRDPEAMENDLGKLMKFWDPMWFSGRGLNVEVVSAKLEKVAAQGRDITFTANGKTQTIRIGAGRTEIEIDDVDGKPSELKEGLNCDITYPVGGKEEALKLACTDN